MSNNRPSTSMTHVPCESKLRSFVRSSMHLCPGNVVAIGRAVVYYARAAHTFSAGIKCRHCITNVQLQMFCLSFASQSTVQTCQCDSSESYGLCCPAFPLVSGEERRALHEGDEQGSAQTDHTHDHQTSRRREPRR